MIVTFRVDGSRHMGAGHVMRCLALAEELSKGGHRCVFVAAAIQNSLVERIRRGGWEFLGIEPVSGISGEVPGWDSEPLQAAAQREDAARTCAALGDRVPDWMVLDHYLLSKPWELGVRGAAQRIAVIDDLANRLHECEILLDQTCGRAEADYIGLVPDHARVLAGGDHALLRGEFATARASSLVRRQEGRGERILISLGTGDVGGVSAIALRAVLGEARDWTIDLVLGEAAPSMTFARDMAAAHDRIELHVDTSRMASLMARADISIGAAGMTSWERCCLGLPSVVVVLAENQRESADFLHHLGAGLRAELTEQAIGAALRTLVFSRFSREAMSRQAAGLCDGAGAQRVANLLCAL